VHSVSVEVFYAGHVRLGESVCWHPGRETVWWVDILGRRIFEAGLAGGVPRVLACPQLIGAVAPCCDGGLIAALHEGIYLIHPEHGEATPWCVPPDHEPKRFRFNDGKVDPRGRFWAGTLALDGAAGQAKLYRIEADRSITAMREGVSISNGIAWSLDGGVMYYVDSPTLTVQAFDFDLETGSIGPPRRAIQFAPEDGLPDGCAMDSDGHLWVAHWGGSKVTCSDPRTGRLVRAIPVPVRNVTSCAFVGPKFDQMIITTAAADSPAEAGPEDGFVFRCHPGAMGAPLASFQGGP